MGMMDIVRKDVFYHFIVEEIVLGRKTCIPVSCRRHCEKRGSALPHAA